MFYCWYILYIDTEIDNETVEILVEYYLKIHVYTYYIIMIVVF